MISGAEADAVELLRRLPRHPCDEHRALLARRRDGLKGEAGGIGASDEIEQLFLARRMGEGETGAVIFRIAERDARADRKEPAVTPPRDIVGADFADPALMPAEPLASFGADAERLGGQLTTVEL